MLRQIHIKLKWKDIVTNIFRTECSLKRGASLKNEYNHKRPIM